MPHTLTQSRVSPTAMKDTATSPTASSTGDVSWTSATTKKKSFLRRKRTTSSTVPTYTRSQSSSQLSVDSSTYTANEKPKRRSLLSRILKKSPKKKSLVIETKPQDPTASAGDSEQRNDHDTAEVDMLQERGQELRLAGQVDEAFGTWQEALTLAQALPYNSSTIKCNQIRCRMIGLHLQLQEESDEEEHWEQVEALVGLLQPLTRNDNSASLLYATPQFLDLLIQQNCWTYALQLSHQLPETSPLTLARLHLEVALQESDERPIAHLSECHQLLLSVDDVAADTVWKELAQAYASIGEDELAMGCSQSRLELVGNSPHQVALAHYDQALNVYSPVGQYGLALKEAELALDALQESRGMTEGEDPAAESNPEESELLLTKLYKLKADVLCRMGRIQDSIQSYEELLQAYLESSRHGPVDAANVLYILGKLSVRMKQFHNAIQYFDREMEMTMSVVGHDHLAISKILHEQARVADVGLMDYPLAVQYYQRALSVENAVYEQCRLQQREEGATLASSSLMQEARSQMADTKQRMGKLHFKMGDFATAVKTTLSVEK